MRCKTLLSGTQVCSEIPMTMSKTFTGTSLYDRVSACLGDEITGHVD
jgi:hypothetical protein